jgi:TatD DNase family protein
VTAGWFDSHCHVQEEYLGGDGERDGAADLEPVLARAREAGIGRLVCIGTGAATSDQAVRVARATAAAGSAPRAWASIGLHPHEASQGVDEVAALLARELAVGDGAVVAVGECGLDYFYEHSPRAEQRAAFAAQIALAHAHGLALVIHARDAWADLFDVLGAEGVPDRTVLHCFTGGPDEVELCLRAGMYVSFSGIVTFKNAGDVRAAAALSPLDRLLVETDSPFLAPVPHRGRPNEPSYLPLVGEAIAAVKACSVGEIMERSATAAAMAFSTGG